LQAEFVERFMKEFPLWMFFVIGAFLSWGCYVPVLHEGQTAIGGGNPKNGALRAFLCVGLAYFATAVVVPLIVMYLTGEPIAMSGRGFSFAFMGGVLGAAGALCIVFALKSGGSPMYVPPLVFAGAPIVNAIVSIIWHPPELSPGPRFWLGIVMAGCGAGLVLYEKASLDVQSKLIKDQLIAKQKA
jgi:uncharacterized membrane protein